jgi:UDP-N-acetyl-D-mannosaminuronate dehydrogenase
MNVAIIGMGFVGLSLAVVLASKKVIVYGLENNRPKLNQLKS